MKKYLIESFPETGHSTTTFHNQIQSIQDIIFFFKRGLDQIVTSNLIPDSLQYLMEL